MVNKFNRLYVIGIVPGKLKNYEDATFRLILETEKVTEDRLSTFSYKSAVMNYADLFGYLWKHRGIGANIDAGAGNKLKALQGDFTRYDISKNKVAVILGEVRNIKNRDELLGYRIATADGKVTKKTVNDVLAYCLKVANSGGTPIANAKFMQSDTKKMHLKSYLSAGFNEEYIVVNRSNTHSKNTEVHKDAKDNVRKFEAAEAEKNTDGKKKLSEIFTPAQIKELRSAKDAGVNLKYIANNKFSPEQMNIIWTCEAQKLPGRLFADPEYSVELMDFYCAELETGVDIRHMLNPAYTTAQLFEISLGYEQGVDISKYANPKNSVEVMRKKREDMANKIWTQYKVLEGTLGK